MNKKLAFTLLGALIVLLSQPVFAVPVTDLNDNFNATSLDSRLWIKNDYRFINARFPGGTFVVEQLSGHGTSQIKSNYYFIEDFDAQINVKINPNARSVLGFQFFRYGNGTLSYTNTNHATNWGYAAGLDYLAYNSGTSHAYFNPSSYDG